MWITKYEKKKQSFVEKWMKTNDTDNFALDEIYIDIYSIHPYITRLMASRMYMLGWTTTEIKLWHLENGIFFPKSTSSFSDEIEIQWFPLKYAGIKQVYWKKFCKRFLSRHYPNLLWKSRKNNKQSLPIEQR